MSIYPSSITILLLSANPIGTALLRLDEEKREIEIGLERSQQRERFQLVKKDAVRPRDFQRAMLDLNPQFVHFSGHGEGQEGIAFEDDVGHVKFVDAEALAGLFKLFADQVQCVILNACYSENQAEAIARYVPYVIGMSSAIGDRAAIEFAVGFYDALGAGRDIEFAYALGCQSIQLSGIPEHLTPVLKKSVASFTPLSVPAPTETSPSFTPASPRSIPKLETQPHSSYGILSSPHKTRLKPFQIAGVAAASLAGVVAIGISLQMSQTLSGSGSDVCFKQAAKQKKLVLAIASIQQQVTQSENSLPLFQDQVFDSLKKRTEPTVQICLTKAQARNEDEAMRLGKKLGAAIVIWGRQDNSYLDIKVTTITRTVDYLTSLRISPLALKDTQQFSDILATVNIMSSFALSEIYQWSDKQTPKARQVLADALALSEPPDIQNKGNEELARLWAKAYYFLGQLYFPTDGTCEKHERDCYQAIDAFDRGATIYPEPYESFIDQGVLLRTINQLEEAAKVYSELIQIAPDSRQARVARGNRAEVLIEQKNYRQAEQDLQIVCKRKDDLNYWYWLSLRGRLELLTGKTKDAQKTFQEIKAISGQNKERLSTIAIDLKRLSQTHAVLAPTVQAITIALTAP
jgi:tetratricopeptide (TPR) repeat protein